MECLFQFLDEMDDIVIATALRLQRLLSWKQRERRKVPRTNLPPIQHPLLACPNNHHTLELRFAKRASERLLDGTRFAPQ